MEKKNKPPKQHKCKVCGSYFIKTYSSAQQVCSVPCASKLGKINAEKKRKEKSKVDRAQRRARLEKLKTRAEWLKDLQKAFNKFIRLRDHDKPCISCGRFHSGKYDAGHYRSVGSCPELRFNEDNVHRQCVPCNQHKGGNAIEYRLGLIERIGLARVEFLERKDHPPLKLTVDEIKDLIKVYKAKVKELQNAVTS